MRFLDWLVLLPLSRRLIHDKRWHVAAAIGTGITWFIIAVAASSCGGNDSDQAVSAPTAEATVTDTNLTPPRPVSTEGPEPSPEPTERPQPSSEPARPTTAFGTGTFIVGEDVVPGLYANSGGSLPCFWERLSGFGGTRDEIITNEGTKIRQIVLIKNTDAGFTSEGCGTWTQEFSAITSDPTADFSDGIYLVGIDIAAGTWRNEGATDLCYWARLSGFTHELDDIIANDVTRSQQIVTVASSDAGFESNGCGTWKKL